MGLCQSEHTEVSCSWGESIERADNKAALDEIAPIAMELMMPVGQAAALLEAHLH